MSERSGSTPNPTSANCQYRRWDAQPLRALREEASGDVAIEARPGEPDRRFVGRVESEDPETFAALVVERV
jgi:hypothetical protein